jgi:hypothetical protein
MGLLFRTKNFSRAVIDEVMPHTVSFFDLRVMFASRIKTNKDGFALKHFDRPPSWAHLRGRRGEVVVGE